MKFIVERLTDSFAVLEKEDMSHIEVKRFELPEELKEGNVLILDETGYKVDKAEEILIRNRIKEKQNKIFKTR